MEESFFLQVAQLFMAHLAEHEAELLARHLGPAISRPLRHVLDRKTSSTCRVTKLLSNSE